MLSQISDYEYLLDEDTIVDRCFIPLEEENAENIQREYTQVCREFFKKTMLSSDYPDYPDYLKKSCQRLYSAPKDDEDEGQFDLDGAFEILDQMLDEHIERDCRGGITIIGSAPMTHTTSLKNSWRLLSPVLYSPYNSLSSRAMNTKATKIGQQFMNARMERWFLFIAVVDC